MRFARVGDPGDERPVVFRDGGWYDLRPVVPEIDPGFFAGGGVARARAALDAGELASVEAAGRFGPPLTRPGAILCIGMNYAAHAAESGSAPPEVPILFFKHPNTLAGADDVVTIPRGSVKTDWEVELAVVVGSRASYLDSPADAAAHIAGYAVANDLSERTWQLETSGGQWSKGKSAPGFTPLGPWIATPDELEAGDVRLRSWVNGEPRQDSRTSDLVFPVDELVWSLSQHLALEPGDVILTGTPQGVALSGRFPYLAPGDVVELEIDGLGRQRQEYVAWGGTVYTTEEGGIR